MRSMVPAVLGTVALIVTGCGGDGKSGEDPPTKAEYIAKADDVCRDTNAATKPLDDKLQALPADAEVKDIASIVAGGLTETRKGLARLRALQAPSEDKATLDAFYATFDKGLAAGDQFQKAAKANDEAEAKQIPQRFSGLVAERQRLGNKYGFKVCGIPGATAQQR